MQRLRLLVAAASLTALAACGGGATGTTPYTSNSPYCDPGTQVQLARPSSGQFGVPTSTTQIEIVANGNSNTLYTSYSQYQVILVDQFGRGYNGGQLALTSDSSGPHPYTSDFYYNSAFPNGLPGGVGFTAYLNVPSSNCSPIALGNFST